MGLRHPTKPETNPPEQKIYDLDDPLLSHDKTKHPTAAQSITCRFKAIPRNEPGIFTRDITQYGSVLHESRDSLVMRVPARNIDLLDRIRQVWVSKYLPPGTECTISFGLPSGDPEGSSAVIIQRLRDAGESSSQDNIPDVRDGVRRRDFTRPRSTSLPLPAVFKTLDEPGCRFAPPQFL